MSGPAPNRLVTAALAFAVVLATVAAQRVDDVLQALHLPGAPSAGVDDVASFDTERGQAAVESWAERAAEVDVALWYCGFHAVVLLALPALLGRLLRGVQGWPPVEGQADLRRPVAWALRYVDAAALVVGLLAAIALVFAMAHGEAAPKIVFLAAATLNVGWIALSGALALLLAAAWALRAIGEREERIRIVGAVSAVRLQIAVTLMFSFLLHGPVASQQAADVMLRWVEPGSDGIADMVAALLLTVALSAVVLAAAGALVRQDAQPWRGPVRSRALIVGGLVVAAIGVVCGFAFEQLSGLAFLGAAMAGYGALALVPGAPQPHRPLAQTTGTVSTVPRTVAAIPLVALGLAIQSAAIGEYVYVGGGRLLVLVLLGAGVQALGWLLIAVDPRAMVAGRAAWMSRQVHPRVPFPAGLVVGAVIALLLSVEVLADPWRIGDVIGTVGIFAAFSMIVALVAYLATQPEQIWAPPPVLAALGAKRRLPVLAGLLVWLVLSGLVGDDDYHDARVVSAGASLEPATLDDAFDRWRERNADALGAAGRESVPLVLIAATGGGVRAAYWTARSLEEATAGEPEARDRLFALSGASGGSVGNAFFTARGREVPAATGPDWVQERLGQDFLAPTWAWTLFADVPQAFLHLDWGRDRAEVLERAWENAWTDDDGSLLSWRPQPSEGPMADPIRRRWEESPEEPLLLLNSTSVADGCRLNVSVLAADGRGTNCLNLGADGELSGTEDATDVLCDTQDLRLSTAALMSARFPFVTPSGALHRCEDESKGVGTVRGVDGGYFDNTGASPIRELWPAIERRVEAYNAAADGPCVVPVMLQLDNTYESRQVGVGESRPFEPLVPLLTAMKVLGMGPGREANNRQGAAHLLGPERYARLFPIAHPGTTPPLGWTLSRISMDDMDEELESERLRSTLDRVRGWFAGRLTCD